MKNLRFEIHAFKVLQAFYKGDIVIFHGYYALNLYIRISDMQNKYIYRYLFINYKVGTHQLYL